MDQSKAMAPKFSVAISTKGYQNLINSTIKDPKRAARFISSITSAVAVNEALQDCDPKTILAGALLGESLNLSPSPQLGQYYLVPFNDRKAGVKRAQFVLGYKGYVQLALRSGQYADMDVMEVKEGEYLGLDSFSGKPRFSFIEDYDTREALPTVGYMAYFEYLNGFRKTIYWPKEKVMAHADKYSQAFSRVKMEALERGEIPESEMWKFSSYWYKDFDGMAKKTLLKQLITKWGITSTDIITAIDADETIDDEYVTAQEAPAPRYEAVPEPMPVPQEPAGVIDLDSL